MPPTLPQKVEAETLIGVAALPTYPGECLPHSLAIRRKEHGNLREGGCQHLSAPSLSRGEVYKEGMVQYMII